MPQPYNSPMNNPAFQRELLERLQRQRVVDQQLQGGGDPNEQILRELARRKALGLAPGGATEEGIRNAEANKYLNRPGGLLDEIYSGAAQGGTQRPVNPGNPFANEPQEFQDMMRRLGVIQ